jgi:hypothetical protein
VSHGVHAANARHKIRAISVEILRRLRKLAEVVRVALHDEPRTQIARHILDPIHRSERIGAVDVHDHHLRAAAAGLRRLIALPVTKISRQQHGAGLGKLHQQRLMAGRVAWRCENTDEAVAEHVVIARRALHDQDRDSLENNYITN